MSKLYPPGTLDGPIVKTREDAWNIEEKFKESPHGWVQWKGTEACMDIHCKCGALTHIDGEFLYTVKCGCCNRIYSVNGHVQFIEILEDDFNNVSVTQHGDCDPYVPHS